MNKVLKFVRLDFITVKPYFTVKNLIIFSVLPFVFTFVSGTGAMTIGMFMILATLYTSYPFAVGVQNGIDALYPTLSIKRGTVVLGRYLFALTFDVCAGIFAYAYSLVILIIMGKNFETMESLVVTLVLFVLFSILQAIQLPIYFKQGYAKGKLLANMPFFGFFTFIVALRNFLGSNLLSRTTTFFDWIAANPLIAVVLGIAVWLGIMTISCRASLAFYNKRDF